LTGSETGYRVKREAERNNFGHFINCKYYSQKIGKDIIQVNCKKYGLKDGCFDCRTCPKCGGLLFLEPFIDGDIIHDNRACTMCGSRFYFSTRVPKKRKKKSDVCNVTGCKGKRSKKYEDYPICDKHYGQIKTWGYHPDKTDEHFPLVVTEEGLCENPAYSFRTPGPGRPKKSKEVSL